MLHIYGTPLSSPTNKVRYVVGYLNLSHEFHLVNLGAGEQKKPEYLKINPYGRVPAIDDDGFKLSESNAIIRYLADKQQSSLYPQELKARAVVDQWIDFATQHITLALGRIMYNTYFYKHAGVPIDERSLADGKKFIAQYLPIVDHQLGEQTFIAGKAMTLADIAMLAGLDTCELCQVDLTNYKHITNWRKKLMAEEFYKKYHESYASTFKKIMQKA